MPRYLVDQERQWFKACIGPDVAETHCDLAFCAHAILEPDSRLIVEGVTQDPRFQESPRVVGPPFTHFYAGAPIITEGGHAQPARMKADAHIRLVDDDLLIRSSLGDLLAGCGSMYPPPAPAAPLAQ